jgi:hypothetical protein
MAVPARGLALLATAAAITLGGEALPSPQPDRFYVATARRREVSVRLCEAEGRQVRRVEPRVVLNEVETLGPGGLPMAAALLSPGGRWLAVGFARSGRLDDPGAIERALVVIDMRDLRKVFRRSEPESGEGGWFGWADPDRLYYFAFGKPSPAAEDPAVVYSVRAPDWRPARVTKAPVQDLSPWFGAGRGAARRVREAADRLDRLHYLPPAFGGEPGSMRWDRWLNGVFGSVSEGGNAIAALTRRLDRPSNALVLLRAEHGWEEEGLPAVERPWLMRFWHRWLVVGARDGESGAGTAGETGRTAPPVGEKSLRFINLRDRRTDFEIGADFFLPLEPEPQR